MRGNFFNSFIKNDVFLYIKRSARLFINTKDAYFIKGCPTSSTLRTLVSTLKLRNTIQFIIVTAVGLALVKAAYKSCFPSVPYSTIDLFRYRSSPATTNLWKRMERWFEKGIDKEQEFRFLPGLVERSVGKVI